jgi:hypothetical protein
MCHMKKIFYLLILLPILCSCNDQKKETVIENNEVELIQDERVFNPIAYVANPEPTDELCISDINKAKSDINENGIVFTQAVGFLFGHKRYEDELKKLCKEKGLKYDLDLIGCVQMDGQTQGCYGAYMDKMLVEKYGKDFKKDMHRQADSLFLENAIKNNTAVYYGDCDDRPVIADGSNRDDIPYLKVTDIAIKKDKSDFGGWPFFDVGFIVETDSTISNVYINSWIPRSESNEKYKDQLFKKAKEHLLTNYPKWRPGSINGVAVRTNSNVRIYFARE